MAHILHVYVGLVQARPMMPCTRLAHCSVYQSYNTILITMETTCPLGVATNQKTANLPLFYTEFFHPPHSVLLCQKA